MSAHAAAAAGASDNMKSASSGAVESGESKACRDPVEGGEEVAVAAASSAARSVTVSCLKKGVTLAQINRLFSQVAELEICYRLSESRVVVVFISESSCLDALSLTGTILSPQSSVQLAGSAIQVQAGILFPAERTDARGSSGEAEKSQTNERS